MPKLSVVIITLNEERNIGKCLESVVEIADDILVVDSFSSDKTREICESYNARVFYKSFEGHIQQKNFAISQAHYPHILSLDADEYLSRELQQSILQVKLNWTHDGYYFNRLTNFCGKWIKYTSWYPSRKLRLWDSRKGLWGGLNPHDRFILQKGSKTKFLKGDLLHDSYYNISEHVTQINWFSSIIALEYYKAGRKAGYWKIIVHPAWRFFRDYFLLLGFLEGFYGLVISTGSAYETFLKYTKLRILIRENKKNTIDRNQQERATFSEMN